MLLQRGSSLSALCWGPWWRHCVVLCGKLGMCVTGKTLLGAGVPVAWKLIPAATPPVYAHPSNEHARRGAFATKQLWVTPHSDDEHWPAGENLVMFF